VSLVVGRGSKGARNSKNIGVVGPSQMGGWLGVLGIIDKRMDGRKGLKIGGDYLLIRRWDRAWQSIQGGQGGKLNYGEVKRLQELGGERATAQKKKGVHGDGSFWERTRKSTALGRKEVGKLVWGQLTEESGSQGRDKGSIFRI